MISVVYFIIALSLLVLVHELGHFLAARRLGIGVEAFSVGFGPKLFSFKRGETEYKLSCVPFGGYVKLRGDDRSESDPNDRKCFYARPVSHRMFVVLAGPFMNILTAAVLIPVAFMVGIFEPKYLHEEPRLIGVKPGTIAAEAGMMPQDIIKRINGIPVGNWGDVLGMIDFASSAEIEIERDGNKILLHIDTSRAKDDPRGVGFEPLLFIANEPRIDKVMAGSPADKAGLRPGDIILDIDGKWVEDWTDMVMMIGTSGGNEMNVKVKRDGDVLELKVLPTFDKYLGKYTIGVQKDYSGRDLPMILVRSSLLEAIGKGFKRFLSDTILTIHIILKLFTGGLSIKMLSGPLGIAKVVTVAAKYGIGNFILLLTFLSIQLGILNLLPIPVLDGGHILMFSIEGLRRRPLSDRASAIIQNVGLAFIVFVMLMVTINDIRNIEVVRRLIGRLF